MFENPTRDEVSGPGRTDSVLSVLAVEARRQVVRYFVESSDRTATVDELTGYVAKRLDDRSRQHVRLNLHHVHVPKLANAGLVEYNPQALTVRYRRHPVAERLVERY